MKNAAIYARVSTREQEPRTQLKELRAYAKRRKMRVVAELVDIESGAKRTRPQLEQLMELVRRREIDVVLVWKFDRFARSSKQLGDALEEFQNLGVDFISYTEHIDTTGPMGKFVFTIFSALAEFERDLIRQRVKAGIDRAREEGIRLGRPPVAPDTLQAIRQLRKKRLSYSQIAKKLGIPRSTVVKHRPKSTR